MFITNLYIRHQGHPDDGESDVAAAARETREETQLREIQKVYSDVFMDVGYSFIKRLHKDRWRKHVAYPDGAHEGLCGWRCSVYPRGTCIRYAYTYTIHRCIHNYNLI